MNAGEVLSNALSPGKSDQSGCPEVSISSSFYLRISLVQRLWATCYLYEHNANLTVDANIRAEAEQQLENAARDHWVSLKKRRWLDCLCYKKIL